MHVRLCVLSVCSQQVFFVLFCYLNSFLPFENWPYGHFCCCLWTYHGFKHLIVHWCFLSHFQASLRLHTFSYHHITRSPRETQRDVSCFLCLGSFCFSLALSCETHIQSAAILKSQMAIRYYSPLSRLLF